MTRAQGVAAGGAALGLMLGGCLGAGDDGVAVRPGAVVGGQPAAVCMWPSALFGRGCSAILIHPVLTLTAAHCVQDGQSDGVANLGEQAPFVRTVAREICHRPPQYTSAAETGAYDIAFCQMQEAFTEVPIVPVLTACEAERVLRPGQTVVIVGFGAPNGGHKYHGEMTVTGLRNGAELLLRGDGVTAGQGDSGGPAFIRMPDGTWRVLGVASRASRTTAIYTLISAHLPWIEQASGVDVTPCHGPDGAFTGGPGCDGFPTDPGGADNGTWEDLCAASPVATPRSVCGAAEAPPDGSVDRAEATPQQDARPEPAPGPEVGAERDERASDGPRGVADPGLAGDGPAAAVVGASAALAAPRAISPWACAAGGTGGGGAGSGLLLLALALGPGRARQRRQR